MKTDLVSVTIKDVAELAGVSIKTVSRVVNQDPTVKERNRIKIELAIEQLGYEPNLAARMLRGAKSYLFALLFEIPDSKNLAAIQSGILMTCRAAGYHLLIEQLDLPRASRNRAVQDLIERSRIDGAVLLPPISDDAEVLDLLARSGTPTVRIAPTIHLDGSLDLQMDDRSAMRAATLRLAELGHRRIGFIKSSAGHPTSRLRLAGFLDGMNEASLPIRDEWIVQAEYSVTAGVVAGEQLLDLPEQPSAVLASNDDLAIGLMSCARARGIAVPDTLSVMGFDDSAAAALVTPTLSSIRQPVAEMASAAGTMLVAAARGLKPTESSSTVSGYELVIRESVHSID